MQKFFTEYGVDRSKNETNLHISDCDLIGIEENKKFFTVTEITKKIKETLENRFLAVWVAGEVSNSRKPSSGHVYLTLKDEKAQLQAVIFKSVANRIKFELKDGMQVIVYGSVSVYEPRGQYQIKVESIEPRGVGALELAFQQLKSKLKKEGLFDNVHKKEIPFLPKTIAIVTSPTGAAIKDMINIINRRFSGIKILLYPVKVQGEGAAGEISTAIDYINKLKDVDVMIVGRGGGSIEDLWAFNEEIVARTIFESKIPVISAVGHEIDVTIADFVADKRALTPSEAAEIVVPRRDILLDKLESNKERLNRALKNNVIIAKNKLQSIANSYAFRKPLDRVYDLQQKLDDFLQRIGVSIKHTLVFAKDRMTSAVSKLDGISPLRTLSRGYSITTFENNLHPIKNVDRLKKGDIIRTRLCKGNIVSVIDSLE